MERMNFFTNKRESSEALPGDNTPKERRNQNGKNGLLH